MGQVINVGFSASRAINSSHQEHDLPTLHQACQRLESVFISYLLESMRKTVPETNKGVHKSIYTSMMDTGIARVVAEGPGIGLASVLYRQLSQGERE